MITYLKNIEGWKHKDLKSKDFDSIKELFDKAFKRVNMFVDFRTDLVEGSSKRAGEELEQESTKKQKVDDDKETAELKQCLEIIPDEEEVTIDAIPLAVKSSRIVDWKILKEGKKNYYQIVRADEKSQIQEGLDKTYDRFQKLISQIEIHSELISQEDANLKLLRSLPSAWNNIALIMRNKSDLDTLSMDDLYNNLKVYESEIKGQTSSNSISQNVAFVSSDNFSNTNETVNTAHSVFAASSKDQASTASYADDVMDVMFFLLAMNQYIPIDQ
ncbi:hypothetical protein Tco_0726962 [Tanacetum coccineum]|uniref:Uncharacterized protein n=1 Tax=Tanacetum coccineum TaxID=301880 RepID=A0ABQ4YI58_9ASTR